MKIVEVFVKIQKKILGGGSGFEGEGGSEVFVNFKKNKIWGGGGCQGRCEQRSEVFVKIKNWGGGGSGMGGGG